VSWDPDYRPQLRAIEPFAIPPRDDEGDPGEVLVGLRDPSGLSDVVLTMSRPALELLAMMDGQHSCAEIRQGFLQVHGQPISTDTFAIMIGHLKDAHFLESEKFETFYQERLVEYREHGIREMPHAEALGLGTDAVHFLDGILLRSEPVTIAGELLGIVAPHLDYPRGEPCYAAAYGALRGRKAPDRVVILGTNHFGRSTSVVATANDFNTPLGTTRTDTEFLAKLEAQCGSLRQFELDHVREHSVELQLAFLQQLFGAAAFTIVPILCPDPCGQIWIEKQDEDVIDLKDFATALRDLVRDDPADTLIVAGADLSHVGQDFGDERLLDDAFLKEVRDRDHLALDQLVENGADALVSSVGRDDNPTRVCSAGCISVLATVLSEATPQLLQYHQAVDQESQTCVTCAAIAYA
jgi:MEMO1 family protein